MAKRLRPDLFHGLLALGLTLFVAAAAWLFARLPLTWYHVLAVWLVSLNVVTFGYFGFDKLRARAQGRRVPELVLHGLALLGGSPAVFLASWLFRHKTVKSSFRFLLWWIAILQVVLIVAIVYRLWSHE